MMRGDLSGRVPFALVAVVLLMGAGLSGIFAAKVAKEEGERRAHEAQLRALGRVADQVHGEVLAQAQHIAVYAIQRGTEALVNESQVAEVFQAGISDYISRHFPRTLRGIEVNVTAAPLATRLLEREMMDIVPSNRTVKEHVDDVEVETPDASASEEWRPVARYAYFEIRGIVNYSLRFQRVELLRSESVVATVPVPAPLMEAKLEQATRRGAGDLIGVGHTVKAIVASLVQYRLMDGYASYVLDGTTTREVLTREDVALAVNFAILLEEVRLFRTFDREAAEALDGLLGSVPDVRDGLAPPAHDRTLARLLDRYASAGTLDAVDLYALWRRFDVNGVSVESLFAQAIAVVQDQVALKMLDYLGLTPLADFLAGVTEWVAETWDAFTMWLGSEGRKSAQVSQYFREMFGRAGENTRFASPLGVSLAARTYTVWNGSANVTIEVPAHVATVAFLERDLLAPDPDFVSFREALFEKFHPQLQAVHKGVRDLANDVAASIAKVAIESGLLPRRVSASIDPKDQTSFLRSLTIQTCVAVDAAMARLRANPARILELTKGLWSSYVALLQEMIDHIITNYDALASQSGVDQVARGREALATDIASRARNDPRYGALGPDGEDNLRHRIEEDLTNNRTAGSAWEVRRNEDLARWRRVRDVLAGVDLPGDPVIRRQLVDAVLGAGGWLVLARGTLDRFLEEVTRAQEVAALRALYSLRLGPIELWDASNPSDARAEPLRVFHTPHVLRSTEEATWERARLREGELWIRIADPMEWSASDEKTPNVHYTKAGELSYRPFVTGWGVRLLGAVRLRVETEGRPIIGPSGLVPFGVEKVWPLEFSFSTQGYSGWNLSGVQYLNSNTFGGDLWKKVLDFLKAVWDGLVKVGKWILDVLGKAVKFLMDLLEPLFAFAQKVVKVLSDLLGKLADLLYDVLVSTVNRVGRILDIFAELNDETRFTISLFGFNYGILVNGDSGTDLEVRIDMDAFDIAFAFVDIAERGITRADMLQYDLIAEWGVSLGPFGLQMAFDPFAAVYPEVVSGSAFWRDSWRIDLTGLDVERSVQARLKLSFEVVTPLGLADVEVGLYASFPRDQVDFWALVERSLREAIHEVGGGSGFQWGTVSEFAQAFAGRLAANLAAAAWDLVEAGVYIEVVFKPWVTAASAGVGIRLSFVADGTALVEILRWVARNVPIFATIMLNPLAAANYQGLAPGVAEHLYLRLEGFFALELPKAGARLGLPGIPSAHLTGLIEANVAALGALVGQQWGRWEVGFGVYVNLSVPLRTLPFGSVEDAASLWLIRGTVHAY